VQGALEVMRIPYTGSGVMGSAIAMDKWRTKLVWDASGIPTPRFAMVTPGTNWERLAELLGLPIIIKPVHEGSTLGLTKVTQASQLPAAYELAARYDSFVIAEEFIEGRELTAAVLGEQALPLVRIEAPQGNYDYQNKYFTDDTKYYCPAGIDPAIEEDIRAVTLKSFRVLGCRGWGRADVILRADGTYSFLELNTSPGMTGHSLVPMAAKAAGLSYADLCVKILEDARLDSGRRE
jgi:D-alanine-D-alanine ligase